MPQTDYMNVGSFKPEIGWKPEGFLGGYMYADREREYQRLLKQAEEARRLGLQRQGQETSEFMSGAPGRLQQQQNLLATEQGKAPYLQGLASETAQTGIAQQQSTRRMIPTTEEESKAKLRKALTLEQMEKLNTNTKFGKTVLETAIEMSTSGIQGQEQARAYVLKQRELLQKHGFDLPPGYEDPKQWQSLYQGAVKTIEFTQDMIKEKQKEAAAQKRTETTVGGQITIGREANASRERVAEAKALKPGRGTKTVQEEYNRVRAIIVNPESEEAEKTMAKALLPGLISQMWTDSTSMAKAAPDMIRLLSQAAQPGPQGEVARRQLEDKKREFFKDRGVDPQNNINTETATDRVKVRNTQGQVGTIPRTQLPSALQQGYTQVQ